MRSLPAFIVVTFLGVFPLVKVCAGGTYFSGKGSFVPGRYSFSDSTGRNNISSSLNLDLHSVSHPRPDTLFYVNAFTRKKTIITPYRESQIGFGYRRSKAALFSIPVEWNAHINLNAYDDQTLDSHDFKGVGVRLDSRYFVSEHLQLRSRYALTQRNVRDSSRGFWHHVFDLNGRYTLTERLILFSGLTYTRNNARSSAHDFLNRRISSSLTYGLPGHKTLTALINASFIDYHRNDELEKDISKLKISYVIPQHAREHNISFVLDSRNFSNVSAQSFYEVAAVYKKREKSDMNRGVSEHTARLSFVDGNKAINDYIDGRWMYYKETAGLSGVRYYGRNNFGGRFWSNRKLSAPFYQHYLEEQLDMGVIFQNAVGGTLKAGPLIGTRQRIDPHARNNMDPDDNPIHKNPWSNVFYGFKALTTFNIGPASSLDLLLDYKNFVNYNENTGTEFVDFSLGITHHITARVRGVANFRFSQNINDLPGKQLDNSLVNIMFKLEYLFDLVL